VAIRTLWAAPEPVPPATPKPKEHSMDPKILRTSLGLAEDASDDDVTARLAEFAARPTPEKVEEQVAAAAEAAKAEVIAAAAADDSVKVDPATFEQLKASAALGVEAHKTLATRDRDLFIQASVGKGKFPPSRVEHYTKRYDSDPEGTRAEIEALEDGIVPIVEIGASTGADDTGPVSTGWFPKLQKQEA
jgi:Mu-like prophage I protein